jgi:hypothetical protein
MDGLARTLLTATGQARRDRTRSGMILEPSSALNQVNDQNNDCNYEEKVNQTAANVADEAKKPEDDQNDNYGPKHGCSFC